MPGSQPAWPPFSVCRAPRQPASGCGRARPAVASSDADQCRRPQPAGSPTSGVRSAPSPLRRAAPPSGRWSLSSAASMCAFNCCRIRSSLAPDRVPPPAAAGGHVHGRREPSGHQLSQTMHPPRRFRVKERSRSFDLRKYLRRAAEAVCREPYSSVSPPSAFLLTATEIIESVHSATCRRTEI